MCAHGAKEVAKHWGGQRTELLPGFQGTAQASRTLLRYSSLAASAAQHMVFQEALVGIRPGEMCGQAVTCLGTAF
jgi:hypothetical protein